MKASNNQFYKGQTATQFAHKQGRESGLKEELQGNPNSANSWQDVAREHPEFFRVKDGATHNISLVARHVIPKDEHGKRILPPDLMGQLLEAAIQLHDRAMDRKTHWKIYIPIIVAITAGVFTILGIFLKSWLSSGPGT